jgi:hypothetical protein
VCVFSVDRSKQYASAINKSPAVLSGCDMYSKTHIIYLLKNCVHVFLIIFDMTKPYLEAVNPSESHH